MCFNYLVFNDSVWSFIVYSHIYIKDNFTRFRVSVKKSLFVFGEVLERSLQPWPTYVCVCPEHRKEADLATEICDSTAKCLTGNKVAQTTCNRLKRRKRDIRWHERFPRKARKTERRSLVKVNLTLKKYIYYYYILRHSLTEIQQCRNVHVQGIPVC